MKMFAPLGSAYRYRCSMLRAHVELRGEIYTPAWMGARLWLRINGIEVGP